MGRRFAAEYSTQRDSVLLLSLLCCPQLEGKPFSQQSLGLAMFPFQGKALQASFSSMLFIACLISDRRLRAVGEAFPLRSYHLKNAVRFEKSSVQGFTRIVIGAQPSAGERDSRISLRCDKITQSVE